MTTREQHDQPGTPDPHRSRPTRSDRHPVSWLLLVPLVLTLIPPLYNRVSPTLWHIPFFYWYQMAVIPVSVLVTIAVYRALSRRDQVRSTSTTGH